MKPYFFPLFLSAHIHRLVSAQVQREYEARSNIYEEICNTITATENGVDEVFVFEWWTVSQDFAYHARLNGEVTVETPFGFIWGRMTTGLALESDETVLGILKTISCDWAGLSGSNRAFFRGYYS